MDRYYDLAVAEVGGGIQPSEGRATAAQQPIRLLEQPHHKSAWFVVFLELILTTFWPSTPSTGSTSTSS